MATSVKLLNKIFIPQLCLWYLVLDPGAEPYIYVIF